MHDRGSHTPNTRLKQLAVLDILGTALGWGLDVLKPVQELEPELWELGAWMDDSGRTTHLNWLRPNTYGAVDHLPDIRVAWELPSELGRLSRMQELGQLPTLEFLDVQDSQLTSLPSLAGLNQLEYLDLSGNRLPQLPPGLELLPFLSRLDLSDNQLATLSPEPGQLSSLLSLDLSGNQLTSLPPAVAKGILDALSRTLYKVRPCCKSRHGRFRWPHLLWHPDIRCRAETHGLGDHTCTQPMRTHALGGSCKKGRAASGFAGGMTRILVARRHRVTRTGTSPDNRRQAPSPGKCILSRIGCPATGVPATRGAAPMPAGSSPAARSRAAPAFPVGATDSTARAHPLKRRTAP